MIIRSEAASWFGLLALMRDRCHHVMCLSICWSSVQILFNSDRDLCLLHLALIMLSCVSFFCNIYDVMCCLICYSDITYLCACHLPSSMAILFSKLPVTVILLTRLWPSYFGCCPLSLSLSLSVCLSVTSIVGIFAMEIFWT